MAKTLYCARCLTTFTDDPDKCSNLSCGRGRPSGGWGVLLAEGDVLDRNYRITKVLAVGGAGLTYLARELDEHGEPIEPDLAIKVLYASRDSGSFLQRLANEAQILQSMKHPNIVHCRGFVHRAGKAPYLITEFEHGGSLNEHVEQHGKLPPKVCADILRQILLALDEAHSRGVVHRDLKPENVLLNSRVGRDEVPLVKLTDFGIAKVEGGVGGNLTRIGTFVGTPEYAAPEQFMGKQPEPATDVFAAGGVLHALLTGKAPVTFTSRMDIENSRDELLAQIPPRLPPDSDEPQATAQLQEILDHVMVPDPQKRWTIRQILARIDVVLGRAPAHPPRTVELTAEGAPPRDGAPSTQPNFLGGHGTSDTLEPAPDDLPDEPDPTWGGEPDSGLPPGAEPVTEGGGGGIVRAAAAGGVGLAMAGLVFAVIVFVGAVGVGGWWWMSQPDAASAGTVLELSASDPETRGELALMQKHLTEKGPKIGEACGSAVKVGVTVVVRPNGSVHGAILDDGMQEEAGCVKASVEALTFPRSTTGGAKARLLLDMGG